MGHLSNSAHRPLPVEIQVHSTIIHQPWHSTFLFLHLHQHTLKFRISRVPKQPRRGARYTGQEVTSKQLTLCLCSPGSLATQKTAEVFAADNNDFSLCMALKCLHQLVHPNELSKNDSKFPSRTYMQLCQSRQQRRFHQEKINDVPFILLEGALASINFKNKWKNRRVIITCSRNTDGPFRNSGSGRTRLTKIIQKVQNNLVRQFKDLQKNFPMKVFFLLLGFYCSTLIVTSIGQTGDWDILSAGLAVAVVEAIGALMYRAFPLVKLHSFLTLVNYWKAGLSLGLFLDAFKY